ncbi:MAG: hypothetical protein ACFCGT_00850, partial [Sandaracinaceae bacterium]
GPSGTRRRPPTGPFATGGGSRRGGQAPAPPAGPVVIGDLTLDVLPHAPSDEAVEKLADALRGYPEVEWACLLQAQRENGPPQMAVGLRVDTAFRQRLDSVLADLTTAAPETLEVLLLDDAEVRRAARSLGEPFYPWRRR